MNKGRIVFAQLMEWLPRYEFDKCVHRYRGNHRVRRLSCLDQFLCMAFAQLTYRRSLRDTVTCLRALKPKLYHAGIRGTIARSTLADANEGRDWRIFADFAQVLILQARKLYAGEDFATLLQQATYALDSSTIELCLGLCPWSKFRNEEGAVKLHTLLDVRNDLPTVAFITPARVHDVNILDRLVFEPGAFYVMDRAYLHFRRLNRIRTSGAFFLIRARKNLVFKRRYSHQIDKATGLRSDQTIILQSFYPRKHYPDPLRRICFFDAETDTRFVFLSNNFILPALSIAELYKYRWHVEIFFKWIKQHLRIKAFYGTSFNAVQTQIWIAISVYVLVAIIKKQLCLDLSLYTILQILSITLFHKTPILQAFSEIDLQIEEASSPKQLYLWDFLTGQ